jgi:hypothetical protein
VSGFNKSRSGVDCGDCGDIDENIDVNEPGLGLFGGSANEGGGAAAAGAGGEKGGENDGGEDGAAGLGAPLPGSPWNIFVNSPGPDD